MQQHSTLPAPYWPTGNALTLEPITDSYSVVATSREYDADGMLINEADERMAYLRHLAYSPDFTHNHFVEVAAQVTLIRPEDMVQVNYWFGFNYTSIHNIRMRIVVRATANTGRVLWDDKVLVKHVYSTQEAAQIMCTYMGDPRPKHCRARTPSFFSSLNYVRHSTNPTRIRVWRQRQLDPPSLRELCLAKVRRLIVRTVKTTTRHLTAQLAWPPNLEHTFPYGKLKLPVMYLPVVLPDELIQAVYEVNTFHLKAMRKWTRTQRKLHRQRQLLYDLDRKQATLHMTADMYKHVRHTCLTMLRSRPYPEGWFNGHIPLAMIAQHLGLWNPLCPGPRRRFGYDPDVQRLLYVPNQTAQRGAKLKRGRAATAETSRKHSGEHVRRKS